ncbi:MAG: acyl-CoA synthetase [Pseudorhodobacter sp.]
MRRFLTIADREAIEAEAPWAERDVARSIYAFLTRARDAHAARPAISYQILSGPADKSETLTWEDLHHRVTRAANLFHSLGIGPQDSVAFVLPNCLETAETLFGGAVAGIVNPINPLLEPEQIASILRESKAKVVVTLRSFPKTDVAQKVAQAVAGAPDVETVLEVDLNRYLTPPKSWIVPLIRPGNRHRHHARVLDFNAEMARQPGDRLQFPDILEDRVAAYFHTGGTTGTPKLARHRVSGMVYNGWLGGELLFREGDVVMCPLPMFHVFAVYPILMSMVASGGHIVFPTPAGYRGDGVFDNFWALIERWKATYVITVPTALAVLMQRKIHADVSSLRGAFSGSAALPLELYRRFEKATGVQVIEGYGLTECTCLVSCNPPLGEKKIGSVGLALPHTNIRILHCDAAGNVTRECGTDEVGEICVRNPGVIPGATYSEPEKNRSLFVDGEWLRTGDLGRLDTDGYLFITGRQKDLIIRGGHNIDPAEIEEALMGHEAVAFVGAIGQPDAHAGELPCAYVELVEGAAVTEDELIAYARQNIRERAAVPKHLEILPELPKTAVGKVFKPDLRRRAIARVYNSVLEESGLPARVTAVVENKTLGLVAEIGEADGVDEETLRSALGGFVIPWELKQAAG